MAQSVLRGFNGKARMKDKERNQNPSAKRQPYEKPKVNRWGTLRDLTHGGGGTRSEPVTKRKTRF
jgi:hypothetical protein